MKLLDFGTHTGLIALRERMGAPLAQWEVSGWTDIDEEELRRRLESIEGIEVNLDDIVTAGDGTFEYKGKKVLVYIRDQYFSQRYPNREYKYHIASCETMEKAFSRGRADRYVVSTRTDGRFLVNVKNYDTGEAVKTGVIEELHVCKNCLLRLTYKGYVSHAAGAAIYSTFSLKEFFEKYGGTRITHIPRHTDATAPPNDYSPGFDTLSRALKEKNGWRCEQCGRDMSAHKEFLHTHHKNGVKGDNSLGNLTTLCLGCHAALPEHAHMRFSPDYDRFVALFGS